MSKDRLSIAVQDVELREVSVFTCPNCKHPTFDYRTPETVDEAICINCYELIKIRHFLDNKKPCGGGQPSRATL